MHWYKQDEMIGCWIMSHVSEDVLKEISCFDTTRDAMLRLWKPYASKSCAKEIQVRDE